MVERGAQAPVVIIFERNEAEGLQHSSARLASRTEKLGHAVYGTGLGLKCDFDEITLAERRRQLQEPASCRDGLEFSFCAAAIF